MADLDTEERRKLAEQGKALPDGSFPIRNREDLKDAIQSFGRAKDKDEAKRWIKRRARELTPRRSSPRTGRRRRLLRGFSPRGTGSKG